MSNMPPPNAFAPREPQFMCWLLIDVLNDETHAENVFLVMM
jgi:hypothetical protein